MIQTKEEGKDKPVRGIRLVVIHFPDVLWEQFKVYKFWVDLKDAWYPSLGINWKLRLEPLVPAPLQGIDFLETS